jgi:UDP:flavonoid glycosyltransferase YjiC (YdhE family)
MSRILCCWEIGAGFGHLYRLYPLVEELLKNDHDVMVISTDLCRAKQVFEPFNIPIFTAPSNQAPHKKFPPSLNYAQNLLRNGFWHTQSLRSRLGEWLELFNTIQPDFILAEHSPVALIAARLAGLPRAAIGTGFTIPPLVSPMPTIQPWFNLPQSRLLQIEDEFLTQVNPVVVNLGGTPLKAVANIFDGAEIFLCTLPELDHYNQRVQMSYSGPILHSPQHQKPEWPGGDQIKVFVYMRAVNRFLMPLLDQLQQLPLSVLACIPDLPETERHNLQQPNLLITTDPVDLNQVAVDCSLMISQGGTNSGTLMLLSGVPVLVCPLELEQAMWAHRITTQGLGDMVNIFNPNPDLKAKIDLNLNNTDLVDRVRKFAQRNSTFETQQTVRDIANRIILTVNNLERKDLA